MRPTKEELEKKTWYRLLKVLTWVLLVLVFMAPWFTHEADAWLIMDGLVSVIIWLIIVYIIQNIIMYVLYGKKDPTEKIKDKQKIKNIFGI